ncbi:hypothetical protein NP150_23610, partial [Salmonella enterica]|nr:hypothetical protein [Salmonella enterica]
MSQLEGYSTARPPLYNGDDFPYWKRRMEVYLKTDIEQWFSVRRGYATPVDDRTGKLLEPEDWNPEMKKKAQVDNKALNTLQCGLTKEELNRVGPFDTAKELWDKLIELHEGTNDSKVTKRDLLLNSLLNMKMQEEETASQLHAQIKNLLNGLHLIGHELENRDIIRYALNAFPRNSLWASIVDAYKVSRNLSKLKLDELFCELELHEQTNRPKVEKGLALIAGTTKEQKSRQRSKPEPEPESESESDEEEHLVNMVRKMFTRRKNKPWTTNKNGVTCYNCNKKGHFKNECPDLNTDKTKNTKRKKALHA